MTVGFKSQKELDDWKAGQDRKSWCFIFEGVGEVWCEDPTINGVDIKRLASSMRADALPIPSDYQLYQAAMETLMKVVGVTVQHAVMLNRGTVLVADLATVRAAAKALVVAELRAVLSHDPNQIDRGIYTRRNMEARIAELEREAP